MIEVTLRGERVQLTVDVPVNRPLSVAGIEHAGCGGLVDFVLVSPPWAVLVCGACYFRILLPETVRTVGDLEQWALTHIS